MNKECEKEYTKDNIKLFEDENKKVYVAIEWYYDGDSNIVGEYAGVKATREALIKDINERFSESDEFCKNCKQDPKDSNLFHGKWRCEYNKVPVFLKEDEVSPDGFPFDFGGYGSAPKFEIREEEI